MIKSGDVVQQIFRGLPWMRRIILAIPANEISIEVGLRIYLLNNMLLFV